MKKRKENMTPDYRKSGYLKVGRSVLRAFFMGERDLRELASVLLCVETFAYFSNISCLCRMSVFTSGLRWSIMNNPYRCNMGNRWHIIRTEPTGMIPAVASGMKR